MRPQPGVPTIQIRHSTIAASANRENAVTSARALMVIGPVDWGTPAELINPATAADKFFDQMVKVPHWQTQSPWTVAQTVQGSPSSDGGIYRDSYQQAYTIVTSLTPTVGNAAPGSVIAQQAGGNPAAAANGQPGSVILASATLNCGAGASVRPASASAAGGGGSAAWGGYANGRIPHPRSARSQPPRPLQLECGAAKAFDELNTAFAAQFGQNIGITDGYRSYDDQVACRLEQGSLCADPGTSNHGWGKAVDIGGCCDVNAGTGPASDWLTANASHYGWTHPAWAQPDGTKSEPWHWEYGNIP
jgi:hypothetical protein